MIVNLVQMNKAANVGADYELKEMLKNDYLLTIIIKNKEGNMVYNNGS